MEKVTIKALDMLRDIAGEQETADEKNVLLGLANIFEHEIKRLEELYKMAVNGRAEMRGALRKELEQKKPEAG